MKYSFITKFINQIYLAKRLHIGLEEIFRQIIIATNVPETVKSIDFLGIVNNI
jgi:hypothetical protein